MNDHKDKKDYEEDCFGRYHGGKYECTDRWAYALIALFVALMLIAYMLN